MTSYRIDPPQSSGLASLEVKADTIGLAVTEVCHTWGKVPENVAVYAWLKDKGREQWIECYVSPDFLKVLASIYG